MLCSKFKQIVFPHQTLNNNVQFRYLITSRYLFKRWMWYDGLLANVCRKEIGSMSVLRFILRDFRVWSTWTRSNLVSTVVKRCKRDRSVREVIQCFKQTFRPRRTLLLSATAAYKARGDDEDNKPVGCDKNITDEELKALLSELNSIETLSRNTLFCNECGKRLVIEKQQPGVPYCACKVSETPRSEESTDGWVPYMEAEDVVIWRKEYKPGLGLYAYKVYGRYPDVRASDFAAVQVDGAYRTVWDTAVAALAVVEGHANGFADQAVLHWEVLWPRLFANRDYVYIRRHKEFDIATKSLPHKDNIFRTAPCEKRTEPIYSERPNVHSKAKRKAMEAYEAEKDGKPTDNKVYVIVSRSCEHPKVPETKHAIRVSEYWSHMVVKTIDGPDKLGMEFVLTYYDEPAVGGMPSTVAAWATGRAAPAYLKRMRRAASEYRAWRLARHQKHDLPEFIPFVKDAEPSAEVINAKREEDMESSQTGPDMDGTREQSTQTEVIATLPQQPEVKVTLVSSKVTDHELEKDEVKEKLNDLAKHSVSEETDTTKADEEEPKSG